MVKDSKVKIKYFDYYVPTTVKPTELTTTTPSSAKGNGGKTMIRDGSDPVAAHIPEKEPEDGESTGGAMTYVVILVVVVIVVIIAVIGIFIYVSNSKTDTNKIKGKPKRSTSRESLASIETVASDTGKPLRPSKPGSTETSTPSKPRLSKSKKAPKKK